MIAHGHPVDAAFVRAQNGLEIGHGDTLESRERVFERGRKRDRGCGRPVGMVRQQIADPHTALKARQGQYAIFAASGHVLKRSRDLDQVLRLFGRKSVKALSEA